MSTVYSKKKRKTVLSRGKSSDRLRRGGRQSGSVADAKAGGRWIFAKVFFYFYCLAFVVSVVYIVFFTAQAHITEVDIRGTEFVENDRVRSVVEASLSQSPSRVMWGKALAGNHYVSLETRSVEESLVASFPQIVSANASLRFPQTIIVEIVEFDPLYAVCMLEMPDLGGGSRVDGESGDLDQTSSARKNFDDPDLLNLSNPSSEGIAVEFVIEEGECLVYDKNTAGKPRAKPRVLKRADRLLQENDVMIVTSNDQGRFVLSRDANLLFIEESSLDNLKHFIDEMPFVTGVRSVEPPRVLSSGRSHVEIITDEGWKIIIDAQNNSRLTLAVLGVFLEQYDRQSNQDDGGEGLSAAGAGRSDVQEIDLRIVDKVFFRRKSAQTDVKVRGEFWDGEGGDGGDGDSTSDNQ